jgi:hypothetical protein
MSDSILILRCPYCTTGDDFKELRAYKDGLFVCDACGHTVRPGVPTYRCTCRNCLKWKPPDRKPKLRFRLVTSVQFRAEEGVGAWPSAPSGF